MKASKGVVEDEEEVVCKVKELGKVEPEGVDVDTVDE